MNILSATYTRQLGLFQELIVDNFAGGGGASTGIGLAGYTVDIAIDYNQEALVMHEANHPLTRHYCESVWDVVPSVITEGKPVALAWFSPDCKHFSKAKGGAPRSKEVRDLAWVAVRWAATVKPRIILLENVEEFVTWGPLKEGMLCLKNKGKTFKAFCTALERLGYKVEYKILKACDYGAPTIRKRLFLIARSDGLPIVWPEATHGAPTSIGVKNGQLKPWRTAAEIIDWSLPCPSIYQRKKPLADNTLRRIAKGIQKYVIDAKKPFIVTCNHQGEYFRGQGLDEPFKTLTASRDAHGLVVPTLIQTGYGERVGQEPRVLDKPLGTVMAGGGTGLVRAFLLKYFTTGSGQSLDEPAHTITTKDRLALVTIANVDYIIADIGMRMLEPHELFAAQGFPKNYIIAPELKGKKLSKTAQVRMVGNSVSPCVAAALVEANLTVPSKAKKKRTAPPVVRYEERRK